MNKEPLWSAVLEKLQHLRSQLTTDPSFSTHILDEVTLILKDLAANQERFDPPACLQDIEQEIDKISQLLYHQRDQVEEKIKSHQQKRKGVKAYHSSSGAAL